MIGLGNQKGLEVVGIHLGSVWELRWQASDACRMQQLNYSYFSKDNL